MKNKKARLQIVSDLLRSNVVGSQEELLELLKAQDCEVTQATLSRDLKQLKVAKTPLTNGGYKYILPIQSKIPVEENPNSFTPYGGVLSIDFSGNLAVIKTKPGYANAIAWDIDNAAKNEVLGTIAGDDTILVIPRDGVSHKDIISMVQTIFGKSN